MAAPVPAYLDYLPEPLLAELCRRQVPVPGVPGLTTDPALLAAFPDLHRAMDRVVAVYARTRDALAAVLARRAEDRAFVDAVVGSGRDVIGARDAAGRVVVGPLPRTGPGRPVTVPPFLAGPAVTLFGPPDDAKMCIHAVNALHRRRPGEPEVVTRLVEQSGLVPRWGADSEDSKTPLLRDLLGATRNLAACFDGTLRFDDERRRLELAPTGRSVPIKRIPGLALPDGAHLVDGWPLPLHLVDLVLHAWANRDRPEAQVFYVPKLENEEEAAYVRALVAATEEVVGIEPGTTRLFVVFESPRAIFRIAEMADALHPYLAGGSLGWHDFLAATARLFRHDGSYRIPVKADPNIVIHHIKDSHERMVADLRPIGAIAIGGMYGTLYTDGDEASYQASMVGYVKDVVTQLRRGLDGFWVAHPDFVRPGIALVEAFRREAAAPGTLDALVAALVTDPAELAALRAFLARPDVVGHDRASPAYARSLLAADVVTSDVIANDDPEEVRYNVFQALQYLAAWLPGNGCVALPATLRRASGDRVFVRVMDDLATTERSRWELWHEVAHGRVPVATFDRVLGEEVAFLQAGADTDTKRIQVSWSGETGRWYPVAVALLRQLVTDDRPVEAVTQLLLPFTFDAVRDAADPLAAAKALCPGRYAG